MISISSRAPIKSDSWSSRASVSLALLNANARSVTSSDVSSSKPQLSASFRGVIFGSSKSDITMKLPPGLSTRLTSWESKTSVVTTILNVLSSKGSASTGASTKVHSSEMFSISARSLATDRASASISLPQTWHPKRDAIQRALPPTAQAVSSTFVWVLISCSSNAIRKMV